MPQPAVAIAKRRTMALSYVERLDARRRVTTAVVERAVSIVVMSRRQQYLRRASETMRPSGSSSSTRTAGVQVSSNWPERTAQTNAARKPPATSSAGGDEQHDDAHAGSILPRRPAHRARAEADDGQRADRHQDRRTRAASARRSAPASGRRRCRRPRPRSTAARPAGAARVTQERRQRGQTRSPPITASHAGTMHAVSSETARPTSAAASAPASFRPSPTISTRRPAPLRLRSTNASLSSGDCRKRMPRPKSGAPARATRRRGRPTAGRCRARAASRRAGRLDARRAAPRETRTQPTFRPAADARAVVGGADRPPVTPRRRTLPSRSRRRCHRQCRRSRGPAPRAQSVGGGDSGVDGASICAAMRAADGMRRLGAQAAARAPSP